MKKALLILCLLICAVLLVGCSSNTSSNDSPTQVPIITDAPDPKAEIIGSKFDGDILFNDIKWGTNRDEVFKVLKGKFPNIRESDCTEYEYGKIKMVVYTYTGIGKVGDMKVDELYVRYLNEEGKYDYALFNADYYCEDLSVYKSMAEMLEYKYGTPYSHKVDNSITDDSVYDVDSFTWRNKDGSQALTITRNNNVHDLAKALGMAGLGKIYDENIRIWYRDVGMDNYYDQQKEIYNAQQKDEEMSNKDYNGL